MERLGLSIGLCLLLLAIFRSGSGSQQGTCWITSRTVDHLSVQHVDADDGEDSELDSSGGVIQGSNKTCRKTNKYCFALWKEDNAGNGTVTIIAQGCWGPGGKPECEQSECVTNRRPPKALTHTNFCCCTGNYCNGNVSQVYQDLTDPQPTPTPVVEYIEDQQMLLVSLAVVSVLLAAASLVVCHAVRRKRLDAGKAYPDTVHLMENGLIHNSHFAVDNLKLEALVGQGRYGSVWKGLVGEQPVAVKVFQLCHRNYFYNELDVYTLPFMLHPSLLSYFGYDERPTLEGSTEYLLFLSLAPQGCVQDYLRANVLDWTTFVRMALTVARGVAYLHTDIRKGDKVKPCICHRDLNTKNILVKEDLTCVLCDLGFATKMNGSKYYYNGEEQHAETKSINDVGTLRYMSPEVLEGAVNLRDCETSLKQIDVYALGLVLWELSSRCGDLYPQGIECPPYKLPFEAEIGHPTFEQMQVLVCRHKARPLFPDLWRDSTAMRTIRETIEDCWDQDAEARLTALCVEERFNELCGLTDRQRDGLGYMYVSGISPTARSSLIHKESHNVLSDKEGDSCLSESTLDTLLTISPTIPLSNCKNSNQLHGVCPSVQPYQGRNPCLERNLMHSKDCDSGSGELVARSHKHTQPASPVSEYLSLYTQQPSLSEPTHRPNVPIPFVQNVYSEPQPPTPKQSNVPQAAPRKHRWWKILRRRSHDVSPQVDCSASTHLISHEATHTQSTPTCEEKLDTHVALANGKTETKLLNGRRETKMLPLSGEEDDVLLLGTQNNRRPNTLPIMKASEMPQRSSSSRNNVRNVDKMLRNIERQHSSTRRSRSERNAKTKSLSEVDDLKIVKLESNIEDAFYKNLRTLEAASQNSLVQATSRLQDNQTAEQPVLRRLKDTHSRVKTPGDMPLSVRRARGEKNTARFSLYDDRIMSGLYDDDTLSCTAAQHNNNGDIDHLFNSFEDVNSQAV